MITFIAAVANVVALGARETEIVYIESLRFNTRSPSGWIMLVTIVVLPLDIFILVVRFLNFSVVIDYFKIALIIVSGTHSCLHWINFCTLLAYPEGVAKNS